MSECPPPRCFGGRLTGQAEAWIELESAHARVGGDGPPAVATRPSRSNRAYAVILASQFQGFCRDLHDECIKAFLPSGIGTEWEDAIRSDPVSGGPET